MPEAVSACELLWPMLWWYYTELGSSARDLARVSCDSVEVGLDPKYGSAVIFTWNLFKMQ
jgi:hypothetical protein